MGREPPLLQSRPRARPGRGRSEAPGGRWVAHGWTHIQRGETALGIGCCERALRFPRDPSMPPWPRAVLGYGLVKRGNRDGIATLAEAGGLVREGPAPLHLDWTPCGWPMRTCTSRMARGRARLAVEVLPRTREPDPATSKGWRSGAGDLAGLGRPRRRRPASGGGPAHPRRCARNEVAKTLVAPPSPAGHGRHRGRPPAPGGRAVDLRKSARSTSRPGPLHPREARAAESDSLSSVAGRARCDPAGPAMAGWAGLTPRRWWPARAVTPAHLGGDVFRRADREGGDGERRRRRRCRDEAPAPTR